METSPTYQPAIPAVAPLALAAGLVAFAAGASPAAAADLVEVAKLVAADPDQGDGFASDVAVDGDVAVFGAPASYDGGSGSGAAFVFTRVAPGEWVETRRLARGREAAAFGQAVAIEGDLIAVAAPFDEGGGTVYLFRRDAGGADDWGLVAARKASDGASGDFFAHDIDLEGDLLVAGAPENKAAYVFARDQGGVDNWGELARLTEPDLRVDDSYGWSVAVGGDTAFIGAWGDDDAAANGGAAYVYRRDEGGADQWGRVAKVWGHDTDGFDQFGRGGLESDGELLFVGVDDEEEAGSGAGAVYVFARDQGGTNAWGEVAKLLASDASTGAGFGVDVGWDPASRRLAVGADNADGAEAGTGAAYVLERDGAGGWSEIARVSASDGDDGDELGFAVAIAGGELFAGSPDDGDLVASAGAAYLFHLPGEGPTLHLVGTCPGTLTLAITGATPGAAVAFLHATGTGEAQIPPGAPCAGTVLGLDESFRLGGRVVADSDGAAFIEVDVPVQACGQVLVQALDVRTCGTSGVVGF